MSNFIRRFFELIVRITGFSWSAPSWMSSIKLPEIIRKSKGAGSNDAPGEGSGKTQASQAPVSRARINKKIAIALAICIPLAAGLLIWALGDQPDKISVSVDAPGITELKKDAKPEPLRVRFSASAAELDKIGKQVTEGVALDPAISGSWSWRNDTSLVFTPAEDWAVGQKYTVIMQKSHFPKHVLLEDYKVSFRTRKFRARLQGSEFYQDPVDPTIKKAVATIKFTHTVDTDDFEKRISLKRQKKVKEQFYEGDEPVPFTVEYDEFKGEAYIHSAPMGIPEDDERIVFHVDDGMRSSRGGPPQDKDISAQVIIPGMYSYFRVESAGVTLVRNKKDEPEQVLIVETSVGVLESEMLSHLSAYLLPLDKPPVPGGNRERIKNYHWSGPDGIGPEVLKESVSIELEPIPSEKEYSKLHTFRIVTEEKRHVYIKLGKGVNSFGGYVLAREFDAVDRVPEYPRELKVMTDGAVLSLSGQKKISLLSRDVEAVKFEVGRVVPGQINHLVTQSGGNFSNPYFTYNFSEDNIVERFSELLPLKSLPHGKTQYFSFDFKKYFSPQGGVNRGLFFLKVSGWDMKKKRTTGLSDKRFVLITDLGLLVKDNADGSHEVFVMSIGSGTPAQGVKVDVLGLNGLPVVSATTGAQGRVSFPSLKTFEDEKKPTVYVARRGADVSFLPYNRGDRALNISRFDVGGEYTQGKGERLNAYLFSDRGIYRPGDEFHVGMIVKSTDWSSNVDGVPLEAVITDPRGLEIKNQRFRLSPEGFNEIEYTTEESSPTGEYQVSLYIAKDNRRHRYLGSTVVKVEEFLPDRMKITSRFSEDRREGWVSPDGLKGHVTLMNLYGTPATDRRVAADISLSPTYPSFRAYRQYKFFDPMRAKDSFHETLSESTTDDSGEASFDLGLQKYDKATYRLTFSAEGYEAQGGRAVLTQSSVLVSPMQYLVGYKADGKLDFVNKDSERYAHIIAVDKELHKISVETLRMKLVEQRYVSVLKKQPNGTFKYQSELKETTLKTDDLTITQEGLKYRLPTDKAGDYVLAIVDSKDLELNRIRFSVAGSENLARSLDRNAELQIKLNKRDFSAGETIELQIKAPYTGAGLITIEKDKVYASKWFNATTTSSVQSITVPADLEGNGYVSVAFVRALNSDEIFMSPLSYGVEPFSVSLKRRDIGVKVEVPDLARPGEPLKIKYWSERPGKVIVVAVDEGILQVAHHSTPNPLAHFFKKSALEVRTMQILDLLLPEYAMVMKASSSGGDFEPDALGKNLNPFKRKRDKPVAYWSGIVAVGPEAKELEYNVPDYFNGRLRVMAVAVSADSVGATEASLHVRGHFVLSPNVPTFVGPGDEFEVSVNVANNVEESGKDAAVVLELNTSEHLSVLDEKTRTMNIDEGREKTVTFRIKAMQELGSGNFTFTASMADKRSSASVDLSVRPPSPYIVSVSGGHLRDTEADVPVTRAMYPQFRKLLASASHLPLGLARGLIDYLESYPCGCTEQIVSQAFPALVLRANPDFGYAPAKVDSLLSQTMKVLRSRQNSEGAFGFWAANSHVSPIQTVYALHFLTEAKDAGYGDSVYLLKRALPYMKALAQRVPGTMAEARATAYAIYIMTRNGIVTTENLSALHKKLEDAFKGQWEEDLTALYMASTYKMLALDDKAAKLINPFHMGQGSVSDFENFYDGLIRDSQYVYLISRHFPERMSQLTGDELIALVKPVTEGRFNTLSSAYTILAMKAYADSVGLPKANGFKVTELLADSGTRALDLPSGTFPSVSFSDAATGVRFAGTGEAGVFYQVTQAGFDMAAPKDKLMNKIEVQRDYRDQDGRAVNSVTIGAELTVNLKIRAVDSEMHSNVAIVDLLPGGFEVVMDQDARSGNGSFIPEYVDVREDRVLVFGTASASAAEFTYRIRATNKGTFTIPPIFAEGMYDRTVQALSLGGTITVVEAQEDK